jgi:hypothetical protein
VAKGVRLKRQQPSGDVVTPHDFRLHQDAVQAALDLMQSDSNAPVDNTVIQNELEDFLRSGCKYLVAADQTISSRTAVVFATKVFDGFAQVAGNTITPKASGVWWLSAALRLTGGSIAAGTSVRLVVYDVSTGTPIQILQGQECPTFTDQTGSVVAIASINEALQVYAWKSYFVAFEIVTGVVSGLPVYGSATVKTATVTNYTGSINPNLHDTVTVGGSYFQAAPIAQTQVTL